MNVQEKINMDNNWKELTKQLIDNCVNYNEYQKLFLKVLVEAYYEKRKNTIIQNDTQAKLIESMIKENKQ